MVHNKNYGKNGKFTRTRRFSEQKVALLRNTVLVETKLEFEKVAAVSVLSNEYKETC